MSVIEVAIGPGTEPGTFAVSVVDSPAGEAATTVTLDVETHLRSLPHLQQSLLASAVSSRRALPETERPLREIGHVLFHTLLGSGDVAGRYRASAAVAAERGEGLRVVLRIGDPRLAGLPWEAMFDEITGAYVCRMEPLVRHVPVASVPPPLMVSPPLRILVVISSPRGLPPLDVEKEADLLTEALAQHTANGLVELHWATRGTWSELQDLLIGDAWHVVHFIGHGDFDSEQDEGLIALVGDDGRAALVGADRFVDLLRQARPMPRLVVLNSCAGAATGQLDVFAGTAAALVRGGVSAVAAMQFEISDPAAKAFSHGFYAAIAAGRGIDDALSSARVAILGVNGRTLEWVTPVLYLRGDETRLFTFPRSERRREPGQRVGPSTEGTADSSTPRAPTELVDAQTVDATADPRYLQAVAALFSGRWDEAVDNFTTLRAAYPNDQRIQDRLREAALRRDLAAWYRGGAEAADRGDWNAAVSAFDLVISADSSYLDAEERLNRARWEQRRSNLIDDLRRLHAGRQWQAAIAVGKELAALDPSSADLDGLISQARDALAEEEFAARYENGLRQLDRGEWTAALDTFGGLQRERPSYRDTPSLLRQLHQRQEEQQQREGVAQPQQQVRFQAQLGEPASVVRRSEEPAKSDPTSADPDGLAVQTRRHQRKRPWVLTSILAAILLGVGGAVVTLTQLGDDGGSAEPPTTSTVEVPGTQAWTDTQVQCESGVVLDIAATGTVVHNTALTAESGVGPDGDADPSLRQYNVAGLPDANHGALIGSLDRIQPFLVGSGLTYPCPGDGGVFLGINDAGLDNNSGQFDATITRRTG